jgi:hypothetical protein
MRTTLLLVLALMTCAASAAGQPTDAEKLFNEGRKQLREGQFAMACEKFAASHALDASVGTLLNLGECNEKQDRLATALGFYRDAATLAAGRNDAERVELAHKRAAQVEPRVIHLTVAVLGASASKVEVRLDGTAVPLSSRGNPLAIDAGLHTVTASTPEGRRWSTPVVASEDGSSLRVEVPALNEPAPASSAQPAPASASRPLGAQRVGALVVMGAGAVSLVISGLFALSARSQYAEVSLHCDEARTCDRVGYLGVQAARQSGDVALLTSLVGLGALAGGAALWFTAPRAAVLPGGAVVGMGGSF